MALKELSMQIFLERKMLRFEQSLRKITFKGISLSLKKSDENILLYTAGAKSIKSVYFISLIDRVFHLGQVSFVENFREVLYSGCTKD